MMNDIVIKVVKRILNDEIKTAIFEFNPNPDNYVRDLNNKETGVTCNFYKKGDEYFVDINNIRFGEDTILPESTEHALSLVGNIITNNHIILSNRDNLNVRLINDQIFNICKRLKSRQYHLITIYKDDTKEDKYGVVPISYCS